MHSMKPATGAPAPSQPLSPAIGLDALPRQVAAHVVDLRTARDASEQQLLLRLMEIGFLPGEPVRIVATGFPGGDPLAVRVGQATFALRRHAAALVRVTTAGTAAAEARA